MDVSKYLAKAMITDPSAVQSRAATMGFTSKPGSIFCSIPELGLEGTNLVYCRYGLSIPYILVQPNWTVWVEPTIVDEGMPERWIYTGLADCGSSNINPASTDQLLIQLLVQVIYATTAGTMHLSSKTAAEAFVLGTKFKVEIEKHKTLIQTLQSAINGWTPVPMDGGAALKTALTAFLALPLPNYSSILSTKIFGE